MFTRNLGILTEREQQRLTQCCVSIAGVGGDGGLVAEQLCRLGVGSFRLADPEVFELENLNRQNGSTRANVGRAKVDVIAELITAINPAAVVELFPEGVQPDNVERFVRGADLVIDESEYTMLHIGVSIARTARRLGVPVLTGFNVAFGTLVTSFEPDGMTLERYLGVPEDATLDELAVLELPLERWLPRLPGYVDAEVVAEVSAGKRPAPSVSPGVAIAAGAVATQAFTALCGRGRRVVAPQVLWLDLFEQTLELFDHAPR
ncbi:MAG TPA: ThiF family adenylyltransferase [Acidimicrobiales bacterium]